MYPPVTMAGIAGHDPGICGHDETEYAWPRHDAVLASTRGVDVSARALLSLNFAQVVTSCLQK